MQSTQNSIQRVAARVGPAVVGLGRGARGGSGVVTAPGRVLTLARNLRGDELALTFVGGREAPAKLVGADPDVDLAVLAADTAAVEPVEWAPAQAAVALGTAVVALADPAGRGLRVTPGYVSGNPRSFRGPRGRLVAGVIEHTAPLPRGGGGGPLCDRDGLLLGLNAVRLDGGLILALPGGVLRERSEGIAAGRSARAPRLGVAVTPPRVARRMRRAVGLPERDGLLVRAVEDGSPAAGAGIARGDLIVAARGRDVSGIDDLYDLLDAAAGADLELRVVRGVEELELVVALREPAKETAP
jgi:serine protease Do